jgi:hypothetical protein
MNKQQTMSKAGQSAVMVFLFAVGIIGIFVSLGLGFFCLLVKMWSDGNGAVVWGCLAMLCFIPSVVCVVAGCRQAKRTLRG